MDKIPTKDIFYDAQLLVNQRFCFKKPITSHEDGLPFKGRILNAREEQAVFYARSFP